MSTDSQPHHSEGHVIMLGSSSNVAQFGQLQLQSTHNQSPQIFNFMDHHHNLFVKFFYQQVPSTYTNFSL